MHLIDFSFLTGCEFCLTPVLADVCCGVISCRVPTPEPSLTCVSDPLCAGPLPLLDSVTSLGTASGAARCLSRLPSDPTVPTRLELHGLCFPTTVCGDGSSGMSGAGADTLFSSCICKSPQGPAGRPGSTIHGSVPCSSWEITSGLETWSPIDTRCV